MDREPVKPYNWPRITIVLGGVRSSGKDTIADLLKANHAFQKYAFANPMKEMAKLAFPTLSNALLYGDSSKREVMLRDLPFSGIDPRDGWQLTQVRHTVEGTGPTEMQERRWWQAKDGTYYPRFLTPRLILQTLGTEWGRRLKDDVWAEAALSKVRADDWPRWVITEQRFQNEVERAKDMHAITVRLVRGFYEARDRLESKDADAMHPSEVEFLSIPDRYYDYVLDNRCALNALPGLVAKMAHEIVHNPQPHWLVQRNAALEIWQRGGRPPEPQPMRIAL
jgi:hypothetical protein